jgi:hypothetical protein
MENMKVYVVIEIISMNSFTDSYGDVANDKEEIIGIYDSKEKAKRRKEILDKDFRESQSD